MDINDRIKEIRVYFSNDKNKDFAIALDESPTKVNNWVRNGYSIGISVIDKILKVFPTIDANWLLTGEGEMLKRESPKQELTNESDIILRLISEGKVVHFITYEKAQNEIKELSEEIGRLKGLLDQNGIKQTGTDN